MSTPPMTFTLDDLCRFLNAASCNWRGLEKIARGSKKLSSAPFSFLFPIYSSFFEKIIKYIEHRVGFLNSPCGPLIYRYIVTSL